MDQIEIYFKLVELFSKPLFNECESRGFLEFESEGEASS